MSCTCKNANPCLEIQALPKEVDDDAADDEDDRESSSGGEDETGLEPAASAASMEKSQLPLLALELNEVSLYHPFSSLKDGFQLHAGSADPTLLGRFWSLTPLHWQWPDAEGPGTTGCCTLMIDGPAVWSCTICNRPDNMRLFVSG